MQNFYGKNCNKKASEPDAQTIDNTDFPQIVGAYLAYARRYYINEFVYAGGHEVLPYIFESKLS